jgi:hypothetical protein
MASVPELTGGSKATGVDLTRNIAAFKTAAGRATRSGVSTSSVWSVDRSAWR